MNGRVTSPRITTPIDILKDGGQPMVKFEKYHDVYSLLSNMSL